MESAITCTANRVYIMSGIFICLFGIIFNVFLHQFLVQHHVSKTIALKQGSFMRKFWKKLPFPYEFHAYLFNISNPNEILLGEKPVLKEIGPFVYDVWQEKINVEDHKEDDTLSYTLKKTFYFNAAKSNGLSDEDEFTLVHYMYLGMANGVLRSQPTVLPLVSKSIDSLYNKPKSLFVTVMARKYLFDGYEIDCVGIEEFFAKVVCNNIKEHWFDYRIKEIKQDFYTTSAWGTFNHTVAWTGRTRINRGIRKIAEIGKIIEYNNSTNFAKWNDEKCDEFLGTDGTMFHPFIGRQEHLYKVDNVLSRSFDYQYDSDVEHNKLRLFRYTATVGADLDTNPADKCYCLTPDRCLKDGVFELWKCMNWALVASNPHFYLADPYYNDTVVGLDPNKDKHISTIDVHPLTGIVIRANFRVQFNAPLTRQPKYRLLKNVSEALLPIGWTEEKYVTPDPFVDVIKRLHVFAELEKFIGYAMIAIGLLLFIIGIVFDYMEHRKSNPFL
ncbi:sensory neuron membrane protein 1-like [Phymastichus coffea]|uniref:sensory neuron membrane protein 1-like n=1 Tax=Phymastichus coffea TaxID=108790 RepID=UPI00273A8986|nr:sensory neuron membrane protein 1-like [Phymastichus coffea]